VAVSRASAAHFAAPAAFLLVLTIAVLLVRGTLRDGSTRPAPTTTPAHVTTAGSTRTGSAGTRKKPLQAAQYYHVRSGDTLGAIAYRFHTTVERLMTLNPGVEPTALRVGQRVRVA
jgi:LysM repeat protein